MMCLLHPTVMVRWTVNDVSASPYSDGEMDGE